MALSNYDSLVMNHKGEPCKGEYVSPLGIEVKVYKDWLYVEDNFSWRKGVYFAEPTVMEINSGVLTYKDVNIICVQRESKHCDTVTCFCIWNGWEHRDTLTGIVGACQFGNIQPDVINVLQSFLNDEHSVSMIDIPEIFKNFDLSVSKRFKQGDMYFHDKIGTDIQCTVPGEAKGSMFGQLLGFEK